MIWKFTLVSMIWFVVFNTLHLWVASSKITWNLLHQDMVGEWSGGQDKTRMRPSKNHKGFGRSLGAKYSEDEVILMSCFGPSYSTIHKLTNPLQFYYGCLSFKCIQKIQSNIWWIILKISWCYFIHRWREPVCWCWGQYYSWLWWGQTPTRNYICWVVLQVRNNNNLSCIWHTLVINFELLIFSTLIKLQYDAQISSNVCKGEMSVNFSKVSWWRFIFKL